MKTLVIVSPLKGVPRPSGKIVLTRKFIAGMGLYRQLWNGPLLHICEPADRESSNLDNAEISADAPEFQTICSKLSPELLRAVLPKDSVVVTSVGEQFNSISAICKELRLPCAYIAEYSLKTRHQIIDEHNPGKIHGMWKKLRQVQQEAAQRKAISIASGVQCNGLPTFHAYKALNKRAHLFFDTRSEASMLASRDEIAHRSFQLRQGAKLRLTFSGRLTLMKGVNDLLTIADHLRRTAVGDWFDLSICGDGDYANQLRADIDRLKLRSVVKMRGNMDFKTELVPFLKTETDLFVCCHRQGDPSCTYLETMACGVPIIGYANEAWDQLSEHARTGWTVKAGDTQAMAERIAQLYQDTDQIEREAVRSLDFAQQHTFERTFHARVEHMKSLAALP